MPTPLQTPDTGSVGDWLALRNHAFGEQDRALNQQVSNALASGDYAGASRIAGMGSDPDAVLKLQKLDAQRQIGNSLASGDAQGGANIAYQKGLLDTGDALQKADAAKQALSAYAASDPQGALTNAAKTGDWQSFAAIHKMTADDQANKLEQAKQGHEKLYALTNSVEVPGNPDLTAKNFQMALAVADQAGADTSKERAIASAQGIPAALNYVRAQLGNSDFVVKQEAQKQKDQQDALDKLSYGLAMNRGLDDDKRRDANRVLAQSWVGKIPGLGLSLDKDGNFLPDSENAWISRGAAGKDVYKTENAPEKGSGSSALNAGTQRIIDQFIAKNPEWKGREEEIGSLAQKAYQRRTDLELDPDGQPQLAPPPVSTSASAQLPHEIQEDYEKKYGDKLPIDTANRAFKKGLTVEKGADGKPLIVEQPSPIASDALRYQRENPGLPWNEAYNASSIAARNNAGTQIAFQKDENGVPHLKTGGTEGTRAYTETIEGAGKLAKEKQLGKQDAQDVSRQKSAMQATNHAADLMTLFDDPSANDALYQIQKYGGYQEFENLVNSGRVKIPAWLGKAKQAAAVLAREIANAAHVPGTGGDSDKRNEEMRNSIERLILNSPNAAVGKALTKGQLSILKGFVDVPLSSELAHDEQFQKMRQESSRRGAEVLGLPTVNGELQYEAPGNALATPKQNAIAPSGSSGIPQMPSTLPPGSQYSPSRQMWRDPSGKIYDANGRPQ